MGNQPARRHNACLMPLRPEKFLHEQPGALSFDTIRVAGSFRSLYRRQGCINFKDHPRLTKTVQAIDIGNPAVKVVGSFIRRTIQVQVEEEFLCRFVPKITGPWEIADARTNFEEEWHPIRRIHGDAPKTLNPRVRQFFRISRAVDSLVRDTKTAIEAVPERWFWQASKGIP